MPLSQLARDDSGSPVVHYGTHVPAATSTPTHVEMDTYTLQQEDTYQQMIPGISQGSLYPTLASLSSEERTSPEETQTLHDKVSKGLEKYLQDAEQHQALKSTTLMTILQAKMPNLAQKTQNRHPLQTFE